MFRMIKQYLRDTKALFTQKGVKKTRLLLSYNKLCAKNLLFTKILGVKTKKERVLGYTVHYDNFNSFFGMFTEIFIHGVYSRRTNTEKPVIVDCGANIGLAIIYFKHHFPKAKIVAFEPDRKTFEILEQNIKENRFSDVTIHNAAVSDKNGRARFYSLADYQGGPGNTLDIRYIKSYTTKKYYVPTKRLSSLGLRRIDILKIDVEGAEGAIFKDLGESSLLRNVEMINLEYHYIENNNNNKLSDILREIEKSGFRYIINADSLINDKVTVKECLEEKRYVLIINCFRHDRYKIGA